jgi:OOP family OmpA-OmpF porin
MAGRIFRNSAAAAVGSGLLLLAIAPAQAANNDESGWYVGNSQGVLIAANTTDNSRMTIESAARLGLPAPTLDTGKSSAGIRLGYHFNNYLDLEGGYVDSGERDTPGMLYGALPNLTPETQRVHGFNLNAVGSLPLSTKLSLYGKLGAVYSNSTLDPGLLGLAPGSAGALGSGPTYGLGLKYDFTRSLGARLQWEHFRSAVGGGADELNSTSQYSLGFYYRF